MAASLGRGLGGGEGVCREKREWEGKERGRRNEDGRKKKIKKKGEINKNGANGKKKMRSLGRLRRGARRLRERLGGERS